MLLEPEEMRRFALYCRRQSESARAIAEQMEKLQFNAQFNLSAKEKQKAAAYAIVAIDLETERDRVTLNTDPDNGDQE